MGVSPRFQALALTAAAGGALAIEAAHGAPGYVLGYEAELAGVLGAVAEKYLEIELEAAPRFRGTCIDRSFALFERALRTVLGDPELHRPLALALNSLGEGNPLLGLMRRRQELWREVLEAGATDRLLRPESPFDLIGDQMYLLFRGAITEWAIGEIEAAQVRIQLLYGAATLLLAFATDRGRKELEPHLDRLESQFARLRGRTKAPQLPPSPAPAARSAWQKIKEPTDASHPASPRDPTSYRHTPRRTKSETI